MNTTSMKLTMATAGVLTIGALLAVSALTQAQNSMAGGAATTAPAGGMMCDMKMCREHMNMLDQAIKQLDAAKKAADGGDAKAAADGIDQASKSLKDVQAQMQKMMKQAPPTAPAGVVNARCPVKGNKINPANVPAELTREFKGQKVGFCCAGCPEKWDKMTDAEKEKALAGSMNP
jgi:hypothetical protein